jgi:hypothetical protein
MSLVDIPWDEMQQRQSIKELIPYLQARAQRPSRDIEDDNGKTLRSHLEELKASIDSFLEGGTER